MATRKKRRAGKILLGLLIFLLIVVLFSPALVHAAMGVFLHYAVDPGETRYLGIVEGGQFQPLMPRAGVAGDIRLTTIAAQDSESPDSKELVLTQNEGLALLVEGQSSDGWLYSTRIIHMYDPVLSTLVRIAGGSWTIVEL
ncbi:MAG: hypothetical protein GX552_02200 [Chloroflexi bacterium]|nr:hypothetical protein [Chloroflexota bacterium]